MGTNRHLLDELGTRTKPICVDALCRFSDHFQSPFGSLLARGMNCLAMSRVNITTPPQSA